MKKKLSNFLWFILIIVCVLIILAVPIHSLYEIINTMGVPVGVAHILNYVSTAIIAICAWGYTQNINEDSRIQSPYSTVLELLILIGVIILVRKIAIFEEVHPFISILISIILLVVSIATSKRIDRNDNNSDASILAEEQSEPHKEGKAITTDVTIKPYKWDDKELIYRKGLHDGSISLAEVRGVEDFDLEEYSWLYEWNKFENIEKNYSYDNHFEKTLDYFEKTLDYFEKTDKYQCQ